MAREFLHDTNEYDQPVDVRIDANTDQLRRLQANEQSDVLEMRGACYRGEPQP